MSRNEQELVDFVEKALSAAGYKVQREVPVGSRHRLDLVAVKDGVRKGVEVKFTIRGILDDLTKSQALLPLPEVDEMYVCRVLRSAGLIVTQRDGAARICHLNAKPLRAIDEWLQDYETFWRGTMRNLKNYVEEKR